MKIDYFKNREILITGGTGSLGKAITNLLIKKHSPKGIRIFSRDELKQWEMKKRIKQKYPDAPISFLVGDVRDFERVKLAFKGVNVVIHAAALKQVPSCEANPLETIKTNINGTNNIFVAALENNVEKVMAISTDKAVYPVNLYGAAKLCMEKLFIQGNTYSGGRTPHFSICRYGNVLGSRGSVVPLFKKQIKEQGFITITHKEMTRFWITLNDVAEFVLKAIDNMEGGEIFVPSMPSASVLDIAHTVIESIVSDGKTIIPQIEVLEPNLTYIIPIKEIGIRPGEKIHETLISKEESHNSFYTPHLKCHKIIPAAKKEMQSPFEYRSDTNTDKLTTEKIKEMIDE